MTMRTDFRVGPQRVPNWVPRWFPRSGSPGCGTPKGGTHSRVGGTQSGSLRCGRVAEVKPAQNYKGVRGHLSVWLLH